MAEDIPMEAFSRRDRNRGQRDSPIGFFSSEIPTPVSLILKCMVARSCVSSDNSSLKFITLARSFLGCSMGSSLFGFCLLGTFTAIGCFGSFAVVLLETSSPVCLTFSWNAYPRRILTIFPPIPSLSTLFV